jgi:hypothetical protein
MRLLEELNRRLLVLLISLDLQDDCVLARCGSALARGLLSWGRRAGCGAGRHGHTDRAGAGKAQKAAAADSILVRHTLLLFLNTWPR